MLFGKLRCDVACSHTQLQIEFVEWHGSSFFVQIVLLAVFCHYHQDRLLWCDIDAECTTVRVITFSTVNIRIIFQTIFYLFKIDIAQLFSFKYNLFFFKTDCT